MRPSRHTHTAAHTTSPIHRQACLLPYIFIWLTLSIIAGITRGPNKLVARLKCKTNKQQTYRCCRHKEATMSVCVWVSMGVSVWVWVFPFLPFSHYPAPSLPPILYSPTPPPNIHHTPRQTARPSSAHYLHAHVAVEQAKIFPCSPKLSKMRRTETTKLKCGGNKAKYQRICGTSAVEA